MARAMFTVVHVVDTAIENVYVAGRVSDNVSIITSEAVITELINSTRWLR